MTLNPAPDLSNISIVVLSYNRKDALRRNLPVLSALVEQNGCELIVVDNASTDGSPEMIAEALAGHRNMQFIVNDANLGVSDGRNAGWRLASREFIAAIDDDIEISAYALAKMLETARQEPDIGLISPDIVDSTTGRTINEHCREVAGTAPFFYEACFLLPRSVLAKVGYLDSNLAVAGEGMDYSLRLRKAGFRIIRISSAQVVHVDRIRTDQTTADRRRKWLWSFCYVYWKNMKAIPATWYSIRVFLAHVRTGGQLFGLSFVVSLPGSAISGSFAGRVARIS